MMPMIGVLAVLIALALCAVSAGTLIAAACLRNKKPEAASTIGWMGRICSFVVFGALTVACGVLVICFMNGDVSILYVVNERSNSTSEIAWLYKLAGLWAGREGSLLFWAWLISCFNAFVSFKQLDTDQRLDDIAIGIAQAVLLTFLALIFFSESNMPFIATPADYFDSNGSLIGEGLLGMNVLLEHWAMAVHPPTLFIGYAGLTLPFAYGLAALITGDSSTTWVMRVNGITAFAWLFLGIGIGLGAVWAYVVLGWGGYWGWDPVENASLLSWLVCTALMHSFTLYRTHGTFKRWSIVCACFAFMFVIVGTFISRSGVVQSVHAFAGDQVSLVLFVTLIIISGLAGIIAIFARRKSFAPAAEENDSSFFSREMGYFLNNLILVVSAFVVAYLTLAPAFPSWMPLGGQSIGTGTFNSLARPVGMLLLLIIAVCPLLGWFKTDPKAFLKKAKVPGICALVLFALLMFYFATVLLPVYNANIAAGDTAASDLAAMGPAWYYNGLAVVGFAIASLLFFNSIFMFVRTLGIKPKKKGPYDSFEASKKKPGFEGFRRKAATVGGMLSHASLGIILIGLIGSSMYVTEHSGYLAGSTTSQAPQEFTIQNYSLKAVDANGEDISSKDVLYTLTLDVTKDGKAYGTSSPKVQVDESTMQQKLLADVKSEPLQDLFVVFRGLNADDDFSLDVRVNPLISFVWVGFVLFIIGNAIGCIAKRPVSKKANQPAPAKAKAKAAEESE